MTMFDVVKKLCDERKISINDLEVALDYSKNTLYRLKTQTPGADKLQAIADYFNVSTDYLLGRTNNKHLNDVETIAAHMDDDLSEDEIEDIKEYIQFIKSKRK